MTIKGMDISYWQGNVDFARVAADGIKFAILREGYAQTVDAKFRQYVEGCRKNGIEIKGVYHFSYAINAEQAAQEAAFCIKQMEQAGLGKDVIVFYDFEYDTVKKAKAKGASHLQRHSASMWKAMDTRQVFIPTSTTTEICIRTKCSPSMCTGSQITQDLRTMTAHSTSTPVPEQ